MAKDEQNTATGIGVSALYDWVIGGSLKAKQTAYTASPQVAPAASTMDGATRSLANRFTTEEESCCRIYAGQTMGHGGVVSGSA